MPGASAPSNADFVLGPDCPSCGPESLIPVCRALAVASWGIHYDEADDDAPAGHPLRARTLFSTRRPRDAIAGVTSGAKTFSRCVAAGAASLLSAPAKAAERENIFGKLHGLGEGAAQAMLLPLTGAAVATVQCARGVINTPVALVQSAQGWQWNNEKRQWISSQYSLKEEAIQVRRIKRYQRNVQAQADNLDSGQEEDGDSPWSGSPKSGAARRHARKDTDGYYALLQVQPESTSNEIRRAYYTASRLCHPDKVGADKRAVAQFHKLSEAYKVLRSADLRRAYDRGGEEAVSRLSTTVDLGTLYSEVMSGAQWEPYIGRFALSRILAADPQDSGPTCLESLAEVWCAGDNTPDLFQRHREVRLAMALAERLQPAVRGNDQLFENGIRAEASRLADAPFAPGMMRVIAAVYESEASRFLGALRFIDPRRELSEAQAKSRLMCSQAHAVTTGVKAVLALHALLQDESTGASSDRCSSSSQDAPRTSSLCLERPAVQAQLPTLATALWTFTVLDIEGTLRRVCRRVLQDSSEELLGRMRRANALLVTAAALREAADVRVAAADDLDETNAPIGVGLPGEDADLLRQRVQEAAIHIAGGNASPGGCSRGGFTSDAESDDSL